MTKRRLTTFVKVVDALGGFSAVAKLTGQKHPTAVRVWQQRKKFPTKYYFVMKNELDALGAEAPLDLWGFYINKAARQEQGTR